MEKRREPGYRFFPGYIRIEKRKEPGYRFLFRVYQDREGKGTWIQVVSWIYQVEKEREPECRLYPG